MVKMNESSTNCRLKTYKGALPLYVCRKGVVNMYFVFDNNKLVGSSKRMITIRNFCRKYSKTDKNFHPQVFYRDDKTKQTIHIKEFDY